MKSIKKFNFIVQAESHKVLEGKIDNSVAAQIMGGRRKEDYKQDPNQPTYCDPWIGCDAWNCNPDCVCKSNLA